MYYACRACKKEKIMEAHKLRTSVYISPLGDLKNRGYTSETICWAILK